MLHNMLHSFASKGSTDSDGNSSFITTPNTVITLAAATSKGRELAGDASILSGLTDTQSFPTRPYENSLTKDYTGVAAHETMVAICATIANVAKAGAPALDDDEWTLWQCNWVRVEEPPPGTSIRTNDGKRPWFAVTIRDCTGTLSLYIQGAAALALSGCHDAEQFEAAVQAWGNLVSANGFCEDPSEGEKWQRRKAFGTAGRDQC